MFAHRSSLALCHLPAFCFRAISSATWKPHSVCCLLCDPPPSYPRCSLVLQDSFCPGLLSFDVPISHCTGDTTGPPCFWASSWTCRSQHPRQFSINHGGWAEPLGRTWIKRTAHNTRNITGWPCPYVLPSLDNPPPSIPIPDPGSVRLPQD